jgi:hypothetical protein
VADAGPLDEKLRMLRRKNQHMLKNGAWKQKPGAP